MIQLQSRIVPCIGESLLPRHLWVVDEEATRVTRSMREAVRASDSRGGCRICRIVDTRREAERAMPWDGAVKAYRQPVI